MAGTWLKAGAATGARDGRDAGGHAGIAGPTGTTASPAIAAIELGVGSGGVWLSAKGWETGVLATISDREPTKETGAEPARGGGSALRLAAENDSPKSSKLSEGNDGTSTLSAADGESRGGVPGKAGRLAAAGSAGRGGSSVGNATAGIAGIEAGGALSGSGAGLGKGRSAVGETGTNFRRGAVRGGVGAVPLPGGRERTPGRGSKGGKAGDSAVWTGRAGTVGRKVGSSTWPVTRSDPTGGGTGGRGAGGNSELGTGRVAGRGVLAAPSNPVALRSRSCLPRSSSALMAKGVWNGLVVMDRCSAGGLTGVRAGRADSGRLWKTSDMGMTILRSAAARAKAGRNFSEIPSRISATPISTRPVANCRETSSSGSVTRTASGTFSGAKPNLAGSASRRTARRLNSTMIPVDADGATGVLRSALPIATTGAEAALGRRGNTDPETTKGAWGGRGWIGTGCEAASAGRETTAVVAAGSRGGETTGWEAMADNGAALAANGLGFDGGATTGGAAGTPDPAKPIGANGAIPCSLGGAVMGAKGDAAGADGRTGGITGDAAKPKGLGFDSEEGAATGI